MRTVWIVSEGSPGHLSQSVGLVNALKEKVPLTIETIEGRAQLGGVARRLVRAWMGARGRPLPRWALENWLGMAPPSPDKAKPDLIVSSGGKSVFAARTLAARSGAPYVFLGERKPYRSEWFHTAFTPSPLETGVNDVPIEMIPTPITPQSAASAADRWDERPPGRLWAMIIGGLSASHRYSASDWDALAEGMNRLAREHGIRWLLTTSRRTGADAEGRLRAVLSAEVLAGAVWWAEKPEKKMAAFLGAAEWVFVTQDSVTMVTEAVASGRPAVLLRPAEVVFPRDSFLPAYFARLEKAGRIAWLDISRLEGFNPGQTTLRPLAQSILPGLAEMLIKRLSWETAVRA